MVIRWCSTRFRNRIWCEARLAGRFKLMDTEGVSLDIRCPSTIYTDDFVDDDGVPYTGGPFFQKFFEHKMKRKMLGYEDIDAQIADRTYFPINYPIIRLEDVMLMYAEIVGPTDKAKSLVDDICERAGVPTVISKPETYELYKLVTKDSYIYPIPDSQMKVKEGLYEQNKGYN